jgi:hypothetical protein
MLPPPPYESSSPYLRIETDRVAEKLFFFFVIFRNARQCSVKRSQISALVFFKGRLTGPIRHCSLKADCTLAPEIVPSFISRGAPHQAAREASTNEGRELNTRICQHPAIYRRCWVLLHASKLGHGADYLTSPPKEGMLRIFTSEKSNGFGRV